MPTSNPPSEAVKAFVNKKITSRFEVLHETAGLTWNDLYERTAIPRKRFRSSLNGPRPFDVDELLRVAAALDLSFFDLLPRDTDQLSSRDAA